MITAQTTSTINNDTHLVRTYDIQVEEQMLSVIRALEGDYPSHSTIMSLGQTEGWLTVVSFQDEQ